MYPWDHPLSFPHLYIHLKNNKIAVCPYSNFFFSYKLHRELSRYLIKLHFLIPWFYFPAQSFCFFSLCLFFHDDYHNAYKEIICVWWKPQYTCFIPLNIGPIVSFARNTQDVSKTLYLLRYGCSSLLLSFFFFLSFSFLFSPIIILSKTSEG